MQYVENIESTTLEFNHEVVLEYWCIIVAKQLTVDGGSVNDNWHVRELNLEGIDLNTRILEILVSKPFPPDSLHRNFLEFLEV